MKERDVIIYIILIYSNQEKNFIHKEKYQLDFKLNKKIIIVKCHNQKEKNYILKMLLENYKNKLI